MLPRDAAQWQDNVAKCVAAQHGLPVGKFVPLAGGGTVKDFENGHVDDPQFNLRGQTHRPAPK